MDIRNRIRAATEASGISKPDFVELLQLIDQHYDKMEATITESLQTQSLRSQSLQTETHTPIEAIFDSVRQALLSVGTDGIVRNCNRVCSHYFGLTKDQLIGSHIGNILPGAKDKLMGDFLSPYMSDLDNTQIDLVAGEVGALRADGEGFMAEVTASILETVGGEIFVVSLRDVTDRKEAQGASRENEERYRALVENAPDAVLVFDVDNNCFTDANDNACALFNLTRARLLTIGPDAISPRTQPGATPSSDVHRGLVDRALAGEHPTFEWTHKGSTGKSLPCEVRFSCLPSDEQRLIRVSITDVGDRKRDEALSFAQNRILEMIAESTPHDQTLRAICRFVENICGDLKIAIMQLNIKNQTLSVEQAPSLPDAFKVCLDFIPVGLQSLTCGAAVCERKDRITTDISKDDGWKPVRNEAAKYGFKATWSFLLHGAAGRVIGTMDVYLNEARSPRTDELDSLGRMARLAGIAIKRHQDEEKLRTSEARYRGLFENVVDGVYIASREGEIITANPALVQMLGYDSVYDLRAAGKTTVLYVNPIDRERVFARLEAEGVVQNFEYRLRCKNGSEIVVLENSRAVRDENGNVVAHEGTITDITERKRAETRIFEEKERAQVTLQSIGDGVITADADGNVDYINPVAQDLTGWDMRSARGTPVTDIMVIVNAHTRAPVENPVVRCLKEGRVITLAENSVLITQNGDEVPIQDSAAPIRDRVGNIVGSVMVFHDVSRENRLFRQLSYQASHDSLTGLINRREFENHLINALEKTSGSAEETHALLYVDLDQFKVVNDTFGHSAGDTLLRLLTKKIQSKIRSSDVLARLGGDEFGILLEHCDEKRAIEVAEDIRGSIEGFRFEWQDSFTTVRCSIGIVLTTSENTDVAELMSSADVACYSAKDMGRNQVHLYQDSDAGMRHEEMKWVSRITNAVEEDRFELFFQPIIGIGKESGRHRDHYEILLRMRDENGELVGPNQFIPAAERYNLMPTLDRWVVHEALSVLADRNDKGPARYTLAINLSGTSLSEDRFLDFVIEELVKQKLPEGAICFEITETAAISNLSRVVHFMHALKKLGCKFSLDDFGSGLSSFTYLKNLPVDYLKIDGQFIRNVANDDVDESMVKAISDVGHAMGIETIAERVETKQVLDKLGSLGIEFAQGYYIAKPASVETFRPCAEQTEQRLA
jgi:diguanylate cyclase (GGDEF)-like protein/PAS domain S-box-containing protein